MPMNQDAADFQEYQDYLKYIESQEPSQQQAHSQPIPDDFMSKLARSAGVYPSTIEAVKRGISPDGIDDVGYAVLGGKALTAAPAAIKTAGQVAGSLGGLKGKAIGGLAEWLAGLAKKGETGGKVAETAIEAAKKVKIDPFTKKPF